MSGVCCCDEVYIISSPYVKDYADWNSYYYLM